MSVGVIFRFSREHRINHIAMMVDGSGYDQHHKRVAWLPERCLNSDRTYLGTQYHRLARRKGKRRAVMAVAHSLLVIIYLFLKKKKPYEELGSEYFDRLNTEQTQRYYVQRLRATWLPSRVGSCSSGVIQPHFLLATWRHEDFPRKALHIFSRQER